MKLISMLFEKVKFALFLLLVVSGFIYYLLISSVDSSDVGYQFLHYVFDDHIYAIKNTFLLSMMSFALGNIALLTSGE